ncbi:NAD(P)-dependent dehydrogenase (short-subunit alcohol dehydrogenase family) [Paenibacillus taihuensis]|uniref:NAD(P)-dependent dehydrogenase (Short-subunit alcohol dehydrogenase family) n=1 Tax=Paenibacillus taihuensis TaxID=1156355 RepID=A0A3D9Q6X5_9BACL|nr:SDR family oxidoreductase [Paenibacillus taihuensis]REE57416.1 NAD(P)-dependent dehydrogenase (short-subunit alcohol dehydrogenase family) [Paenibacillus taihuensis]
MSKNVLITGASRGLGYEIASEALERGYNVIAGVRDPGTPGKLAELRAMYGEDRIRIAHLDVVDEASIAALAARLKQEGRTLGAIINNAAILKARDTQIEDLDMDEVIESFDVNVYGPMRVVKHLLPLLTEENAALINVSSEAGSLTKAYPGDYPYAISKTAMNMFTLQLHSYLKERGVLVLSVHPGWMYTDMGGNQAPTDPRASARGILDLIERRTQTDSRWQFVDYTGQSMLI